MTHYTQPLLKSSALITIDVQQATLKGRPFEVPGTDRTLPRIKMLLDIYRQRNMPVFHIIRIYKKDGSNVDLCRRAAVEHGMEIFLENSPDCDPAPQLFDRKIRLDTDLLLSGNIQEIGAHEEIIYKPRWGAFYQTPLENRLKQLGIDTLVFAGCNFPNCPRTSIYEASERDFKILMLTDGMSGLYPRGEEEMDQIGVRTATADDVRQELMMMG